jgi:hypothetical protein
MFWMNLQTWKAHPFVVAHFGTDHIAAVEAELEELAGRNDKRSDIEWGMRQIVYRRV